VIPAIRWADPFLLHLIALFPAVLGVALLLWWRRRRDVADALGDAPLVRRLAGTELRAFPWRRALLLLPAAALLGVAAAGPRWGEARDPDEPRRGDVVLVLDASNSMLVEDVRPNRLERERAIARELVSRLGGSRVGVVAFAGGGQPLTPLTDDFGAIHTYLDALGPDVVRQDGSSLYAALRAAVNLLDVPGTEPRPGSIVMITDGEALEPASMVRIALEQATRRRITVHTVGIGTAAGGRVPDVDLATGVRGGWKRDPETGADAVSRMTETMLLQISRETGGTFHVNPDTRAVRELAGVAASGGAGSAKGRSFADNRYEWFLGLALVLIALDSLNDHGRQRSTRGREA
jgi:Ca-activated chloride channel family protein